MTAPTKKTVELFFDVISPYTWIGFEVLTRYQHKWNIDLKLRPFFLGGIMKGSDNSPPGFVQNKSIYMMKDLKRLSQHYQIPINIPSDVGSFMFVNGSMTTMRFLTAIQHEHPGSLEDLVREFFFRGWSRDQEIHTPESMAEAGRAIGLSDAVVQDSIQKTKDSNIKNKLKENTEEALEHGAFGSPHIMAHVDGEAHMVFGSDRFHILADLLDNRPPGTNPVKALYLQKDMVRVGHYFQVPLHPRGDAAEFMFVNGSLSTMRFLMAIALDHPEHLEAVTREFFIRGWKQALSIHDEDSIKQGSQAAGLSDSVIQDCLRKMTESRVKDQLKVNTQEALDYGAFGSPTIVAHVDGEAHMLFGSDRFHVLADLLGEKYSGPLNELNKAKL